MCMMYISDVTLTVYKLIIAKTMLLKQKNVPC